MSDIYHACRTGDLTLLHQLVQQDPSLVNALSESGYPPLILVTYSDQLEAARYLVEHGADIDLQDRSGNTALMGAVFKRHTEQIDWLLKRGADVNAQNLNGASALTYACTFAGPEVVQQLLKAGATTTNKDERGLTPVDHARMQGNKAVLELLENN